MAYTDQDVLCDQAGLGMQTTTKEFIELNIKDMVSLIEAIEKKEQKILLGEREFLSRPYEECKNMTNFQVVLFFSRWRKDLLKRYEFFDDWRDLS